MTRVYYKEAVAAVIVFDVTNRRSFQAVTKWKNDLDLKVHLANDLCIPCILLANKYDLKTKAVLPEEIDQLVTELNFIGWFGLFSFPFFFPHLRCLIQRKLQAPNISKGESEC